MSHVTRRKRIRKEAAYKQHGKVVICAVKRHRVLLFGVELEEYKSQLEEFKRRAEMPNPWD